MSQSSLETPSSLETSSVETESAVSLAGSAEPAVVVEREYHHALRRDGVAKWRGAVAIVVMIVGYLGVSIVFGLIAGMIDMATGTTDPQDLQNGKVILTPLTLLAVNLGAASLIPLSMLLQWWLYGVRPRFLSSVRGRFRWNLLLRAAAIVVPAWLVYVLVGSLVGIPGQPTSWAWNVSLPLLAVVVLTTWAQAAGEEYGFRGLVARSVGSWFVSPKTAFVVSTLVVNLIFMVAHLATDPWLIAYYFVFGVALSVVIWRTGGLEVAVLIHATNNILLFVLTGLFSGGEVDMDRSAGVGGPFMLVPMGMMILAAVVVSIWAGRRQIARRTEPV